MMEVVAEEVVAVGGAAVPAVAVALAVAVAVAVAAVLVLAAPPPVGPVVLQPLVLASPHPPSVPCACPP